MDDMPEDLAHVSVDVESQDEHAHEEAGQASTAAGSEGTGGASSEALWTAVYDEVTAVKSAWDAEDNTVMHCFRVSVEGGKWSVERSGRAVQGLRGYVIKGSVL
eukprot:6481487-Amphidinium_carterae.1